jgi:thioredoxin 1
MDAYIKAINSSSVVLIEFFATWCPHCQRMIPIVNRIRDVLAGKVDVYQFDLDKSSEIAEREMIETVPTFIVYKDGSEVWRKSGELSADYLYSVIKRYVSVEY